tara:strand:+ start:2553 stop:3587 length:1035 start_codon:yes stop_codon:yes gene_type:complete
MNFKSALIISPLPLKPVKSGMQNTINLLYNYLKDQNYKIFFYEIKTHNKVDPILNLSFKSNLIQKIKKKINLENIDFVFINTSKILFHYKSFFLTKSRSYKTILVCHDLYHFRKKYFNKINVIDKTKIECSDEIDVLKNVDYIMDFSKKEFDYLVKKKISKKKLVKTYTPTIRFKKINFIKKKKYDLLYVSSNWFQNQLSFSSFFKKINYEKFKFNILILGDFSKNVFKNIDIKSYSSNMFNKCTIGVAIMKNSTGRQTKIFEMLSAGLPVFTNIDLTEFGLRNNFHYKYFDNKKKLGSQLKLLISNESLRKKLSLNAFNWSQKNTFYKNAFKLINKKLINKQL